MMDTGKHINHFLKSITGNRSILTSHITLYTAMIHCCQQQGFKSPFRVTRKELMAASAIRSFATYHKCLKELISWGYISYEPSYDTYKASQINFLFPANEIKMTEVLNKILCG